MVLRRMSICRSARARRVSRSKATDEIGETSRGSWMSAWCSTGPFGVQEIDFRLTAAPAGVTGVTLWNELRQRYRKRVRYPQSHHSKCRRTAGVNAAPARRVYDLNPEAYGPLSGGTSTGEPRGYSGPRKPSILPASRRWLQTSRRRYAGIADHAYMSLPHLSGCRSQGAGLMRTAALKALELIPISRKPTRRWDLCMHAKWRGQARNSISNRLLR